MKRLSFLFSVAAVAVVSMLSSCGDKKEDPKPAPSITAAWVGAAGSTIVPDALSESFTYTATTGESISEINVVATYMSGTSSKSVPLSGYPKTKDFKSSTSHTETVSYTMPTDASGNITLTISVKDSKGAVASTKLMITYMLETKDQFIYNILGTKEGSYDLVEGKALTSSAAAADKDLLDMTSTTTGIYEKGWTSGNGSKFVKASSTFNYADVDPVSAKAAFMAGSALTTVKNVAVNDVYIVQLRGDVNEYAVVKVTGVFDDGKVGTGNNQDYIKFDFKY
jgi:hypothetical protein